MQKKHGLAFLLPFLFSLPLHAETLEQAMVRALTTNPTLLKEQARQRAVDEQVPLAKSGQRPVADFNAAAGAESTTYAGVESTIKPRNFGLSITQPVYSGGSISSGIDVAEDAVLAGRAQLADAEQTLLQNVVTAYMNVARDQHVLELSQKSEAVLKEEWKSVKDRLNVGEATRTDASEAEARFARATADRIQAEGSLAQSQAFYENVVGIAPQGVLVITPNQDALPATLDEVLAAAQHNAPAVIASNYNALEANAAVDKAVGALLPQISLSGSLNRANEQSALEPRQQDNALIMANLTVPLYHGGSDYALIRAAKQTASQKRVEQLEASTAARENAIRAWQSLKTAEATMVARKKEIAAADLAYQGVKRESQVGTRTVLDSLNSEADALQAHVNFVTAERDYEIAKYAVRAATGDLTAAKLHLTAAVYDPEIHYNKVKDAWIGLGEQLEPMAEDGKAK